MRGGQFSQKTVENYGIGVAFLNKFRENYQGGQADLLENARELKNRK